MAGVRLQRLVWELACLGGYAACLLGGGEACSEMYELCLGACEVVEEDALPAEAICDPHARTGGVELTTVGAPGDSFRQTFLCDGQQVAQRTATVPEKGNRADCKATGVVPNGGTLRCITGPGNGNSGAARVTASACF